MAEAGAKTVRCPICGKVVRPGDPNMPFCSDRCRMIDLANWASEKYVISTPAYDPEDEARSDDSTPSEES